MTISAFLRKARIPCNEWGKCRGYGSMNTVPLGSLKVHLFSLPATSFWKPLERVQYIPLHLVTPWADFIPVCWQEIINSSSLNFRLFNALYAYLCSKESHLAFSPVTYVLRTTIAFVHVCPYWIIPINFLRK